MREYGSVSPRFWTGDTGKTLRGHPDAQVLALYLMTSPHANMVGIFYCPVMYMAHETGLGMEGASKALARLMEAGFCDYDGASETVFVFRMAAHQVGEQLKADDKRVLGVRKEYERIAVARMKSRFHEIYKVAFHLLSEDKKQPETKGHASPSGAPPKQLTGTRQEQDKPSGGELPEGFESFWAAWPKSKRKEAKGKCAEVWKRHQFWRQLDDILAHVEAKKACEQWRKQDGEYVPAPLAYLNQRTWEGAEIDGDSGGLLKLIGGV